MRSGRPVLYLLVFFTGAATMGLEMSAARLLAPYFGNSLPVWGVLIALLLAYLSAGYSLGGRLADHRPQPHLLYQIAAWAGFLIGLIPHLAHPVLSYSVVGFANYQAGAIAGSLLAVLALFAAPVILLGCISPFAVRLSISDAASSGNVAGHIYALSTVGSLLGTFSSVFLLIPGLGTRLTIAIISLSLLIIALLGLFGSARGKAWLVAVFLVLILALQFLPRGAIKPAEGMIYEVDSAYNYVQVIQNGDEVLLKLNEGEGIQSSYRPQQVLTGYVYDYFLLAPFFRKQYSSPVRSLCLIGLAGGTIAHQYSTVFGGLPIDGVEIDPEIVDVARRFFDLNLPNLQVAVEDGRYFLAHSTRVYDVIAIDAYRPPYIPFQLTTIEFFRQVRDHLSPDGVVAVNVARTETDFALVDAIASTLKGVYPVVYVMDARSNLNSVLVAPRQASELSAITARLADLTDPILGEVSSRATGRIREFTTPNTRVLTDDHAPVEQIVHAIVLRYVMGQPVHQETP